MSEVKIQSQTMRELPRYKCHKEVWALKIKSIRILRPTIQQLQDLLDDKTGEIVGAIITPEDDSYAPFEVPKAYVDKHEPKPGGYYVVYEDGYKSFSPAEAFESGYTLIK